MKRRNALTISRSLLLIALSFSAAILFNVVVRQVEESNARLLLSYGLAFYLPLGIVAILPTWFALRIVAEARRGRRFVVACIVGTVIPNSIAIVNFIVADKPEWEFWLPSAVVATATNVSMLIASRGVS